MSFQNLRCLLQACLSIICACWRVYTLTRRVMCEMLTNGDEARSTSVSLVVVCLVCALVCVDVACIAKHSLSRLAIPEVAMAATHREQPGT